MNTAPEAEPTDVLGIRLLQMIASLQQDQFNYWRSWAGSSKRWRHWTSACKNLKKPIFAAA